MLKKGKKKGEKKRERKREKKDIKKGGRKKGFYLIRKFHFLRERLLLDIRKTFISGLETRAHQISEFQLESSIRFFRSF